MSQACNSGDRNRGEQALESLRRNENDAIERLQEKVASARANDLHSESAPE